MQIIQYLFQYSFILVTLVGLVIVLAVLLNIIDHTYNLVTEEEKNNSLVILSISLILSIIASLFMFASIK